MAGAAKAARPDDTARAVAALVPRGSRVSPAAWRRIVRAGALAEAALGLIALLAPRPLSAALVALSYLAFLVTVAVARRRGGPLATCGCFGRPDTEPTRAHLLLDLVLAVGAATFAAGTPGRGTLVTLVSHQPWAGVPLLFVSAVGAWLTLLALSALGELEGARRLVRPARTGAVASP